MKCALCTVKVPKQDIDGLRTHWLAAHSASNLEKINRLLRDIDEKLEFYERLAAEGMLGRSDSTGKTE